MKARGRALWVMLLLPPVTLFAVIAGFMALSGTTPGQAGAEATVRHALPYLLAVNHLTVFVVLVWVLRRQGKGLREIGWRLDRPGTGLTRELLVGAVCALGLYLLKELGWDSLEAVTRGRQPTFTSLFNFHLGVGELPMAIAAASLVFVEESVYRGFGLSGLAERYGMVPAVILSSVCFGLLHWGNGFEGMIFATVWGLPLAGIFLWRKNLVAGTVAHTFYNLAIVAT